MGGTFIQIVMGPAGSGKSTYCHTIQEHCATLGKLRRRNVHVANLDPAAENFKYKLAFDIRDLICVDDVMDELGLGPNGSLIYSMEYLLENMDWLENELGRFDDDEYLMLDCPGQIELYTHIPIMRRIIDQLSTWGYNSIVSVFIIDATFVCDAPKFISGSLLSLSAMIALELPHVNVLSKCDLVSEEIIEHTLDAESAIQLWERDEYITSLNSNQTCKINDGKQRKGHKLTEAICSLIDDYSMVSFIPLNSMDEDSVDYVLSHVDHTIQYGEDQDVKGAELDDVLGNCNYNR